MTEVSDIVLYGLAFFVVAFLPLFLWHLWLAPYRIMHERLGEVADTQQTPQALGEEDSEEKAFRNLAPKIRESRDQLVHMRETFDPLFIKRNTVNALIADIGTRLKRLRVPTPETQASDDVETVVEWWIAYLSILTPLADMGDIRNARSITFRDGVVNAPISPAAEGSKE